MFKRIKEYIRNYFYRVNEIDKAKSKLSKKITHKFICKIPYYAITHWKTYYGYIDNFTYIRHGKKPQKMSYI